MSMPKYLDLTVKILLKGKMKSLLEDWRNLLGHQKQVGLSTWSTLLYLSDLCVTAHLEVHCLSVFFSSSQVYKQLAEDDKVRYKNEIKSWEEHMVEIGREDLIREQTLSKKKKTVIKRSPVKKAKTTAAKSIARGNLKTTKKMTNKTTKKSA